LQYGDKDEVAQMLKPATVNWIDEQSVAKHGWNKGSDPFPAWKICVIVGLIALAGETWLLIRKRKVVPEGQVAAVNL
jgi:hypothetical protein